MKQLQISDYEIRNGCYVKVGQPVTDFTISVTKIIQEPQTNFAIQVRKTDNEVYTQTVSMSRLKMKYFLNELPVWIDKEKEFYVSLRKAILQKEYTKEEVSYHMNDNGLQEINGEKVFVFSNCGIGADGLHPEIYSDLQGAYFPSNAFMDLEKTKGVIGELFEQYNQNPEIFYPLFFINIMAISNGYFRRIGEPTFMKITLWLDGASGSGKTELAKAIGNYTFYDEAENKEPISVTGNRKYALNRLAQSSGMDCVLDDVKREQVRERKNSVLNIIDDFIRSVFQGRLTDCGTGKDSGAKWMDACAVITGEYIETNESQNARILYLRVDGFLKEERNSKALRILQENPVWLTTVCGSYIQWFLKKMQESSFSELIKAHLKELRSKEKVFDEINNAGRLNENCHMLEMASRLTEMYFQEIGMSENFVKQFSMKAGKSIKAISDSTFCLLGGKENILIKILEAMYLRGNLRKAKFERGYSDDGCLYLQPHFWLNENDDFLWIEDYKSSLKKRNCFSDDAVEEFLIIREKNFEKLFKEESERLVEGGHISSEMKDDLQINYRQLLREMQISFKQYRTGCKLGRPTATYPVFKEYYNSYGQDMESEDYENEHLSDDKLSCYVYYEPTIQLNTAHILINILKERMEKEVETEDIFKNVQNWIVQEQTKECIYKVRKAFASSKSLYKE